MPFSPFLVTIAAASLLCVNPAFPGTATSDGIALPFDPAIVNNRTLGDTIGPGNRGPATLRAQILLDRANFSPGVIDGHYGRNLRNAIAAFQKSHGLSDSGTVDLATWQILNSDASNVLQPYVIDASDVAGPFVRIPRAMEAKAKLEAS